jgi:F-type H+-transporting ATPase subunit c
MRAIQKVVNMAGVAGALSVVSAMTSPLFAQDGGGASQPLNLQYAGAAIGVGLIVIGAAGGIGRFAAAAADSIARQPQAAALIKDVVSLPLFLLEGAAIIAEVVCLLIVLLK